MITATNISYRAAGKTILHPMSFDLEPGAVTVLLGANGAGKSTLLRLLAGEIEPREGRVLFAQKPLKEYSPTELARKRAVLTQHYAVALPFTAEEIVMMGRYAYRGLSTAAGDREIVAGCMREMEAEAFSGRLFSTLSGGEQQRVQMARVLAQLHAPGEARDKLLLLDEPTSSLDYLQQQMTLLKARTLARRGYMVLIVLHDLNLAAQYADRILLLKEGYLIAEGRAADVLEPHLVGIAYDLDVEIITHEDYDFPILVPALHNQNRIVQANKTFSHGNYRSNPVAQRRVDHLS
jgi:iron complex transport system ATP-binding protein